MNNRILAFVLTLILILMALSLSVFPAVAQSPAATPTPTPTPTPREALIQAIEERAQRDVELGKPPESITGLDVLFSKDAVAVGMSMPEVLEIYEEAYTAAIPAEPWWASLQPNVGCLPPTWSRHAALHTLRSRSARAAQLAAIVRKRRLTPPKRAVPIHGAAFCFYPTA